MAYGNQMHHPDSQFLKALGIALIVNSHLDGYYPIHYFATGGAIGNSIFFALSAFGLSLSQQRKNKSFAEWLTDRIGRIYPSLWIVLLLLYGPILVWRGRLSFETITIFVGYFFNPPFWFLQALLAYWIIAFPLLKDSRKQALLLCLSASSVAYIGCYAFVLDLSQWSVEKSPFDLIHYFMMFLFGIYLASHNKSIKYSGALDYLCLLVIVGFLYLHKYLMMEGFSLHYQFLQQLMMYPIVYFLLKIARGPLVTTIVRASKSGSRIVDFCANNTLEIYLIHETIIYPVLAIGLPFPANVAILVATTVGLSSIVNRISNGFRTRISQGHRAVRVRDSRQQALEEANGAT